MKCRYGMGVTPTIKNNWDKITDKPQEIHIVQGRPDLKVGDTHKVRIKKDNVPPYAIYKSTVLEVYDNYYLELVEVAPEKKTKKETIEAKYRKICFPKADYKFGIDSCDLEGKNDEKEDTDEIKLMQADALRYALNTI